ncbi:hypothetical protein [Pseudolabrys sp. FHR47]|uniref:hypothetical protein n=1 Tax=Pseudolabrys sp. FHR47 TaxID=2562284 RepID=UPI0010BE51D4|nr:hypothetical protein [Pseudolabrys sp. FHR47]
MRTLGRVLLAVVLIIALPIGGFVVWHTIKYPTYTYRYRMTVDVEVGGKLRSGESVIEVKIATQREGGSVPRYTSRFRGEAIFVDLGEGRNVIALLAAGLPVENVNYPIDIVPRLFSLPFEEWARLPKLEGKREVPASRLPNLVTFSDLKDPKSARFVGPHEFPQVFGADVRPPKVVIEMTNAPVTRGILQKLPWLLDLKGYSGGQFAPDWSRPEKNLTAGLFTRGSLQ